MYLILADLILVAHALFVAFVILGAHCDRPRKILALAPGQEPKVSLTG
jgi:hypothetical protein